MGFSDTQRLTGRKEAAPTAIARSKQLEDYYAAFYAALDFRWDDWRLEIMMILTMELGRGYFDTVCGSRWVHCPGGSLLLHRH